VTVYFIFVQEPRSRKKKAAQRQQEIADACWAARHTDYQEAVQLVERPLTADFPVDDDETVVYRDQATVMWDAGTREAPSYTSLLRGRHAVSKTSGGATGAIVGGLLAGPVGAVAGYALSKKTTVMAVGPTIRVAEVGSDPGVLTVTNRRVVFIGERGMTIVEPLADLLQIAAKETPAADLALRAPYFHGRQFGQNEVRFRRASSLPGERFIVRNLAYFMLAMNRSGRSDVPPPQPPAALAP